MKLYQSIINKSLDNSSLTKEELYFQLLETLKSAQAYRLSAAGSGGEYVVFEVHKEFYNYWKDKQDLLLEYSVDPPRFRRQVLPESARYVNEHRDWWDRGEHMHLSGPTTKYGTLSLDAIIDNNAEPLLTIDFNSLFEINPDSNVYTPAKKLTPGYWVCMSSVEVGDFEVSTFKCNEFFDFSKLSVITCDLPDQVSDIGPIFDSMHYSGVEINPEYFPGEGMDHSIELFEVTE